MTRELVELYLKAIEENSGESPSGFWDLQEGQYIDESNIEDWLERHPSP